MMRLREVDCEDCQHVQKILQKGWNDSQGKGVITDDDLLNEVYEVYLEYENATA